MNRILVFSGRNIKETLRDKLSYIFCLGFPLIMLAVMTLVNESIPAETGMTIFRIDNLTGGIIIFGQTFIMLFASMTVAKDRSGSFLIRMFASPMKASDFIAGYILPMIPIAAVQSVITLAAGLLISLLTGVELSLAGAFTAVAAALPSGVMFAAFGVLFGALFNEKAAPGMCSVIISLGSFVGGIWFDAEATGGIMLKICRCTPFFYCTKAVRSAIALDFSFDGLVMPEIIAAASAVVLVALAAAAFGRKMRADLA